MHLRAFDLIVNILSSIAQAIARDLRHPSRYLYWRDANEAERLAFQAQLDRYRDVIPIEVLIAIVEHGERAWLKEEIDTDIVWAIADDLPDIGTDPYDELIYDTQQALYRDQLDRRRDLRIDEHSLTPPVRAE